MVITKPPGSGGQVTLVTCKEQLLYEVHDPARYYQPDVVADFSEITMSEAGPDRVRVEGARGAPKTDSLKVSVGYIDFMWAKAKSPMPDPARWRGDGWRWRSCGSASPSRTYPLLRRALT